MSALQESLNDQDPDYVSTASNDQTQQKIYEENARNTTARKITTIVEREFSREIDLKEKEILQIQERLHKTLKVFHFLRYVIITNFYNRKQNQIPQSAETSKQSRIHPAIKTLIGKSSKSARFINPAIPSTSTDPRFSCSDESLTPNERTVVDGVSKTKENTDNSDTHTVSQNGKRKLLDEESRPRKVPRYVPPKSSVSETACPSRGSSRKVCKRIIVGNISKWIPLDWREDASSHKWTMYVRGNKDESADISTFVNKVRFFLHPSYRPNDVVEITSYPFHLSRRGWGEFPLRVQLHFKNSLNKPMDIIHHLKLDRTYTGLQTLGSETLVDVWIHTAESRNLELNSNNESIESSADSTSVKIESSNSDDSEATRSKQLMVSTVEISRLKINTFEEIPVKKEVIDSKIHERSDASLDLIKKLENRVKVESSDTTADAFNDKNEINLKETLDIIKHDHNYLEKRYSNSHCFSIKEENITIEHFQEVDCASVINVSAVGGNEEKLNNVTVTSNRFNGDIQSSSNYQSSATSNAVNNVVSPVVLTNTELQGNISQSSLLSFDANKYLQAENSRSSDTSKISENISAKDTLLTINGFCKPPDTSLDRLNSLQRAANSSNTCNSHLKPLQISIPSSNMFASSTNKHVLLLKNEKMASVDVTSLLTSKSNENSKKLEGDAKISIARGSKVTKLNVRVPQAVSILKKLPNAKINTQQEIAVNNNNNNNNNKKVAVLTLKGTNSLLLNVNENVPILKIADSRDPQYNYSLVDAIRGIPSTGKQEIVPYTKLEDKTVTQRTKVTLGKDKHKIQSKKELYEAVLQSIDTANIADTEALIRFIIRRLPIVTQDARDPEYKQLHLYACSSKEEYFAHNVGKQRALEWYRAKTIRCFLRKKLVPTDQLWSIKEIMVWARLHGYTPSQSFFGLLEATTSCDTKKLPDTATSNAIPSTCTEPVALQKWLQTRQQESSHQSMDGEVEQIDVESIKEDPCRTTIDRRKNGDNQNSESSNSSALIPLEFDENLLPLHNFVCNTARDIGIKIGPEEIVPGVLHCSASRVMIRVIECFVEDLTRSSLARAWERNNGNECPTIITLNDVRNALINRQEFDTFTNEGLGSRQQLSTTDLSNL